jgi:hypothetical protein
VYTEVLSSVYTQAGIALAKEAQTKIQEYKSRHTIYLQKDFVNDSAFPFKVGEDLLMKVEGSRIVIEKASKGTR